MAEKRKCKIVLIDEVNCAVTGLHADHILYYYEKYGILTESYFFSPKFQLGTWDGKIRFFHKNGKTFIHLLNEIVPSLVGLGYEIEIEDNRKTPAVDVEFIDEDFFSHVYDPDTGEPWKVRDYQIEMVNTLLKNGGGIGIAGTGAGKTSMCAALALTYERAANFRSIIVVPDTTLTEQTIEEYKFFGLDVGEYSGNSKDLNHKHVVSTWQTLKNNPVVITQFNMIIVDECQGLRGPVLNDLLVNHGKNIPFRFGVTGTLPEGETDAMSVKIAVGEVLYEIPAHVLIKEGHLSNLEIEILQLMVNLKEQYEQFLEDIKDEPDIKKLTYKQFKDAYFPDFTAEKAYLHSEKTRLEWIGTFLQNLSMLDKGNVLCLVNGVNFGKKLAKAIPNAVFLHGKDGVAVRKEIYEKFKDNDNLIVIATVNIAGTGLNIKRIFNLVLIDVGKSFIRVIQAIGRGLRKAHDKDFVNIYDICSDLKYSKRHLTKRVKYYKEAKYPFNKRTIDY
jgi:superfamily II DNA or RNA helicase